MLELATNRITLTAFVALLFSAAAAFHLVLPPSVNPTNVVAAIMLTAAVVIAIMRFGHSGEATADAKAWYLSKTIWTQVIAAVFAAATLAGVSLGFDQAKALEGIMTLVSVATMILGTTITRPIGAA